MFISVYSWLKPLLPLMVALTVVWGILINSLRVDWTVNPQYAYGWAVPLLCAYLLARRVAVRSASPGATACEPSAACARRRATVPWGWAVAGIGVFLALWTFTRFVQEANPDWRLVTWAQALEVVGLTLVLVRAWPGASQALFPILFFLVAVPWPTLVELPVIQQLSRANAALTVEVLSVLGVPALQHGNTIEVGTGLVGIDDACSGIRSFQASLMLSLFFGEMQRLGAVRRTVLVGAGFGLAFSFNVVRTSLLTFIAATRGIDSISKWHDPAGVLILVACFGCLLLLARRLGGKTDGTDATNGNDGNDEMGTARTPSLPARLRGLSFALVVGLGVSEAGVEVWYRLHERHLPPRQSWTVRRPAAAPSLVDLPLPQKARQLLRFTRADACAWDDGPLRWQLLFLEWSPGRITPQLARFHNPEVCLSATGRPHHTVLDSALYPAAGLRLPFRVLRAVEPRGGPRFLFYCVWEDRAGAQPVVASTIDYWSRLQRACQGRRNLGLRALEISLQGVPDFETAEALFKTQLNQLVVEEVSSLKSQVSGLKPNRENGVVE